MFETIIQNGSFSTPTPNMTLDELLDSFGYEEWKTKTTSIALPILNVFGLVFCSISVFIFFQKKFQEPIFFYYRLLCLVYCISCLHNIPMGVLFSPRYFPHMNTYASTVYQIYYAAIGNLLFHYQEVLQIVILLTRMKILSKFLDKYLTLSPKFMALIFFLACFVINITACFSSKIITLGEYVYVDSKGMEQRGQLFDFDNSDVLKSKIGSLIFGFIYFVFNLVCTLIVGIVLNVVSFVQYKMHLKKMGRLKARLNFSIENTSQERQQIKLNPKERKDRKIEKNMLYMSLTLCSISIISRLIFSIGSIYLLYYYNTYSSNLVVRIACYFIYSIVPTVAIFVFYSFNSIFSREFYRLIFRKEKLNL